jgi:hypothetical protein
MNMHDAYFISFSLSAGCFDPETKIRRCVLRFISVLSSRQELIKQKWCLHAWYGSMVVGGGWTCPVSKVTSRVPSPLVSVLMGAMQKSYICRDAMEEAGGTYGGGRFRFREWARQAAAAQKATKNHHHHHCHATDAVAGLAQYPLLYCCTSRSARHAVVFQNLHFFPPLSARIRSS